MLAAGATASTPLTVTCRSRVNGDLMSTVQPSDSSLAFSSPGLSSRGLKSLNVSTAKKSYSSVDVAEIKNDCASPTLSVLSDLSGTMSVDSRHAVSSRAVSNSPESHLYHRQTRPISSASAMPVSSARHRSTSCSTSRSGNASRRSSVQSHRPMATAAPLSPSAANRRTPEKREDLIALHREACRIFQTKDASSLTQIDTKILSAPPSVSTACFSPHGGNTPTEIGSPSASPVTRPHPDRVLDRVSLEVGLGHANPAYRFSADSGTHGSTTVIDWTSPSTRKREYAKIDRANRGFRGLWRRVAPKWCKPADHRTPFFEEGKNGKANYEGSVRRFRMDIPEEPSSESGLDGPRLPIGLRRKRAGSEDCPTRMRRSRWHCVCRAK